MPLSPPKPRKRRIVAITIGVSILGIVVAAWFIRAAKHAVFVSCCQSNLHQVGLAILLYSEAHGGSYPDTLGDVLNDGQITPEPFVCPATLDEPLRSATTRAARDAINAGPDGHRCSFLYLGRGLTARSVSPSTVIAYEPLANHSNVANVLFGDGHVELEPATWFVDAHLAR